jgi:hypothetical protein
MNASQLTFDFTAAATGAASTTTATCGVAGYAAYLAFLRSGAAACDFAATSVLNPAGATDGGARVRGIKQKVQWRLLATLGAGLGAGVSLQLEVTDPSADRTPCTSSVVRTTLVEGQELEVWCDRGKEPDLDLRYRLFVSSAAATAPATRTVVVSYRLVQP